MAEPDLISACERSDLAGIRAALAAGADLTATNAFRSTPLMIAAGKGNLAAVRLLLDAGAEVDAPGAEGSTPFLRAVGSGKVPVARLLLERGADPTVRTSRGVGAVLAASSSQAMLEYVVGELGLDPDETSGEMTALGCAAGVGNVPALRWLLDHGADPNRPIRTGPTALWSAVFRGHAEATRLLLDRGADPSGRDRHGASLLRRAVESGRPEVVDLVLDCHAHGRVEEGPAEALVHAIDRGDARLVRHLLVRHGVSPDSRDALRRTPVMLAAAAGRLEIVTILVEAGADLRLRDRRGRTVLEHVEAEPPIEFENAHERWQHTDATEIERYLRDRLSAPSLPRRSP